MKYIIWCMIVITMSLPIFFLRIPTEFTATTGSLYISAAAGYAGIALLLWSHILGTRSVTRQFTEGAPWIMGIHKWLGKYGVLLIFLHPLLIVFGTGESLLYSFIPSFADNYETTITYGRIAFWALLVVWISSALLRDRIAFRPWKYIHYLAYISLPFALLHIPQTGSQFAASTALQTYYVFVVAGLFFVLMLRLRTWMGLDIAKYKITQCKLVCEETYAITMKPSSWSIPYRKGQYIYVSLGFFSEQHPFSIAFSNHKTKECTIMFRVTGAFTKKLAKQTVGTTIRISEAYGKFTQELSKKDTKHQPAVFIAGGIGIVPFIERIVSEHDKRAVQLFYANRSPEYAALENVFKNMLGNNIITRYSEDGKFIDKKCLQENISEPNNSHYYICGPSIMITLVKQHLKKLGIPKQQIHVEDFSP